MNKFQQLGATSTVNRTILTTGFCLFSCLLPFKATAASLFSGMYVFGDSLSDPGNLYNLSFNSTLGTGIPPSPYVDGRFSNGPNWVDYLADDLGLNPIAYTSLALGADPSQGINFAFAGATTGPDNTVSPLVPGLTQEILAFQGLLAQTNQTADPNALYVVWAGANDYLPTESPTFTPFTTPDTSISNLSFALNSLVQAGAQNIMVANLPALGELPLTNTTSDENRQQLNRLTQAHNAALNELEQTLGDNVNLFSLDVNSLFAQAITNPSDFGFTNVKDACLTDYTITLPPDTNFNVCDNPNQYLFWDDKHPTTATHRYIADLALETLNSEPQKSVPEPASVLGLFAIGVFGAGSMLKRQLAAK